MLRGLALAATKVSSREGAVVGVNGVEPAEAQAGLRRLAGELVPRLAEELQEASGSVTQIMTGALSAMLRKRSSLSRRARSASRRTRAMLRCRRDLRQQLARAERLDQVVVGAGLPGPRRALSSPARADTRMTGKVRVRGSARSSRSRPKPSRRGIMMSASTRSGMRLAIAASAASPSATASTS